MGIGRIGKMLLLKGAFFFFFERGEIRLSLVNQVDVLCV